MNWHCLWSVGPGSKANLFFNNFCRCKKTLSLCALRCRRESVAGIGHAAAAHLLRDPSSVEGADTHLPSPPGLLGFQDDMGRGLTQIAGCTFHWKLNLSISPPGRIRGLFAAAPLSGKATQFGNLLTKLTAYREDESKIWYKDQHTKIWGWRGHHS